MGNRVFRRGCWDDSVSMSELDRVGDNLALGVAFNKLEATVRIQCRSNVETFLGPEVP
jgi:hypothetical protein